MRVRFISTVLDSSKIGMQCDCIPVGDLYPTDDKLGYKCAGIEYFLKSSKNVILAGMFVPLVFTRCTIGSWVDSCSFCDSSSIFLLLGLAWSSSWTILCRFPVVL